MNTIFTVLPPDTSIDSIEPIEKLALEHDAHLFMLVMSSATLVPSTVFPSVPTYSYEAERGNNKSSEGKC